MTNDDMDEVFHALSHATRRTILDLLRDQPGVTVGKLAGQFDVTRIAIMSHLNVLERAGLVVSEKDGRARKLYLNAVPIQQIQDRWLGEYGAHFASRMTSIKYAAERAAKKEGNE
ncbi:helix-turn-helix transcriptional regulator [Erythrobacter sp. THAF29]|uniref:ArsR/SmtB family transcription factor n=1 Tax=Erythrobacter sp. THAF29 TaxID=2587851 RepID=UPI0012A7941D|nr:helix-turn-helix transcriptional regulator [Erythrobacter sp. THAF29]QFT76997.1 Transcriptional repressor SdpR [Erythrobacter sp. THAF29]